MLTIRFSRVGKTNKAAFRVVLAENSFPVKGGFVELLGSYDPHSKKAVLKSDRVQYWLGQGVTCSDSAHNLLVREGLLKKPKKMIKMKKPVAVAPKEEVPAESELPKEEKAAEIEQPKTETVEVPAAETQEPIVAPEVPAEK